MTTEKLTMKLDRNENATGKGKYALIKLRDLPGDPSTPEDLAAAILAHPDCVDWGVRNSDSEFFVIRLKDRNADQALHAYAASAQTNDPQWAMQVRALATRAENHPGKKQPD